MQRRAGPKGFGLYADEDVPAGQFLIEYIGEVLEEEEYMRRKQYYIQTGQRHYYFMNIGNGEVIDACRKVCMSAATVGPPYQQNSLRAHEDNVIQQQLLMCSIPPGCFIAEQIVSMHVLQVAVLQ